MRAARKSLATQMIQPVELVGAAWTAFAAFWLVQGIKAKRAATKEALGDRVAHVALMAGAFYLVAVDDPRLGKLNEPFLPPKHWITVMGITLTIAGVAFAIWARHHIGQYWSARVTIVTEHKLIRTGPYAHIRHPIYTGMLVALAGTTLVEGEYRALIGFALALYGFTRKAKKEETFLAAQFGADFEDHRRKTGFFLPKFS